MRVRISRGRCFAWPIAAACLLLGVAAHAEDGYELWLRYRPVTGERAAQYRDALGEVVVKGDSPTLRVVKQELTQALARLLPAGEGSSAQRGVLIAGTSQSDPAIASLRWNSQGSPSGSYALRKTTVDGRAILEP